MSVYLRCFMIPSRYVKRIANFDIEMLELRRLRFDLILVYETGYTLVNVNMNGLFEFTNSRTRGHSLRLRVSYVARTKKVLCSTSSHLGLTTP